MIDKIIIFNPLDKNQIKKIITLWLKDLENRLEKKWLKINYDNKVINFITKDVYNPDFWAREVRRYLVDKIEDLIAEKIISGKKQDEFTIETEKENLLIK